MPRSQRIDFVSDYVETMLGYAAGALDLDAELLAHDRPSRRSRAGGAAKPPRSLPAASGGVSQFRWVAQDGRVVWVEARSQVITDSQGRPIGMRGVTMDFSKHKQMEQERDALLAEARELNRVKDQFLATLSHELRTPINAVLGWTQMLRAGIVQGERAKAALETIERNAMAQQRLTEDLLDVSRIITGKFRLDLQPVDMATMVRETVQGVEPAARAKDVASALHFANDVPAVLGRSAPASTGGLEPLVERGEVHGRGGHVDVHHRASWRRRRNPCARLGRRHRARRAAAHLRTVHTGRQRHDASARGPRTRARDCSSHRRAARRNGQRAQRRTGTRRDVLPAAAGRRPAHGADPAGGDTPEEPDVEQDDDWLAFACCSSTTSTTGAR